VQLGRLPICRCFVSKRKDFGSFSQVGRYVSDQSVTNHADMVNAANECALVICLWCQLFGPGFDLSLHRWGLAFRSQPFRAELHKLC